MRDACRKSSADGAIIEALARIIGEAAARKLKEQRNRPPRLKK